MAVGYVQNVKYIPKSIEIRNKFSYLVCALCFLMFLSSRVQFLPISACEPLSIVHQYYREGRLLTFLNNISEGPHLMHCKIHINEFR